MNYRSHPSIVRAYDGWMASADWSNPDPGGTPFRHAKTIIPHDPSRYDDYPAVIAVEGQDPADEGRQLAELLRFLKECGVIAGYDQAALLLHSVGEVGQQTVPGQPGVRGRSRPLRAGWLRPRDGGP